MRIPQSSLFACTPARHSISVLRREAPGHPALEELELTRFPVDTSTGMSSLIYGLRASPMEAWRSVHPKGLVAFVEHRPLRLHIKGGQTPFVPTRTPCSAMQGPQQQSQGSYHDHRRTPSRFGVRIGRVFRSPLRPVFQTRGPTRTAWIVVRRAAFSLGHLCPQGESCAGLDHCPTP